MIEILKAGKGKPEIVSESFKGAWINSIDPDKKEIKKLRKHIDFPTEVLHSLRDHDEIPTLTKYDKFTYVLIRTPIKKTGAELQFATRPLGILLSKNYFITITQEKNQVVELLKKQEIPPAGIQLLLTILFTNVKDYLIALKEIAKELHTTQEDLEKRAASEDIVQLLELEKSLVYFGTAIKSNQLITERLVKMVPKTSQNKDLFEDILNEMKQAQSMTKIYSIIISEMVNAFSSIISNKLNKRIELLTMVTIILMLPTLLASIYGMNILLPLQYHPGAFVIIMGVSVLLSLIGVIVFWSKRVT